MTFTTRFAPSPTGPLHLGHAYSAFLAYDMANTRNGQFLLRIEDIDQSRARPEWEAQIYDDLAWLGLKWPAPVWKQSEHLADYRAAIDRLSNMGLTYPCQCNRHDIALAASAPQEGVPTYGPDGRIYPGTCQNRKMATRNATDSIRLNMRKVIDHLAADTFEFQETAEGATEGSAVTKSYSADNLRTSVGDILLARRDMGTSYHLSVVLDDAAQNITHVVRGQDLFEATKIHVVLQRLLGLPTPIYHHHRLIRDANGKRLAKRDDARAIAKFRQDGATPDDIRAMVGL